LSSLFEPPALVVSCKPGLRSIDGGKSFSEPLNLSNSMAGDGKGRLTRERWDNGSLDLAMGPEGNLYAAWTDYEGRLWSSRSSDQASFSKPLLIAGGGAEPARGPSLAVDPPWRGACCVDSWRGSGGRYSFCIVEGRWAIVWH
jgi:hypothetical protein